MSMVDDRIEYYFSEVRAMLEHSGVMFSDEKSSINFEVVGKINGHEVVLTVDHKGMHIRVNFSAELLPTDDRSKAKKIHEKDQEIIRTVLGKFNPNQLISAADTSHLPAQVTVLSILRVFNVYEAERLNQRIIQKLKEDL